MDLIIPFSYICASTVNKIKYFIASFVPYYMSHFKHTTKSLYLKIT